MTTSETRDHVSVRLDSILLDLPTSPCNPTIFRVDDNLRCINHKLHDPKVVSIGPFHHGKHHLQKMEQHKLKYLKLLLKRQKQSSVDKFVMAMRSQEQKARKCYAEAVGLSPDEFVEMLILDGFFIIELIRKYGLDNMREEDDTIFKHEQVLSQVRHDLILIENQIPFFVLDQLFSMTRSGDPDDDFFYLIQLFTGDVSPWPEASHLAETSSLRRVDHLLSLVHRIWCSSFAKMRGDNPIKTEEDKIMAINSATALQEAGIKFRRRTKSQTLDIKFIKGTVKIPGLAVSDETESTLRNLIAYEHSFDDNHPTYVTDYAFFLQSIINSAKDVEILCRSGILTNYIGDDKMAYQMINRLGENILVSSDFCYAGVYEEVNEHCRCRRNRWIAILRRDYFNNPWAFISFVAASMLLLFTLTQTVFTVLAYFNGKCNCADYPLY